MSVKPYNSLPAKSKDNDVDEMLDRTFKRLALKMIRFRDDAIKEPNELRQKKISKGIY